MILLTEINENVLSCDSDVKTCALNSALQISSLFSYINDSIFKEIQNVQIVVGSKNIDREIFSEVFQNFNIDYSSYFKDKIGYAHSLYHKFLTPEKLSSIDPNKRGTINRLIRRVKFINSIDDLNISLKYICYLPLSELHQAKILESSNVFIIEDPKKMENWFSVYDVLIPLAEYSNLKIELEKYQDFKHGEEWDEYNYKHAPFLNQFGKEYTDRLYAITFGDKITNKAYFHGEDFIIAKKSIDYFMVDNQYTKYNLRTGVPKTKNSIEKIKFTNIDCLSDDSLNELSKFIRPLEIKSVKIAFQGLKIDLDFYFNDFSSIKIPDSQIIQKILSKLFVSLLIEDNKLKGDVRKLFKIFSLNGFKGFLGDVNYVSDLKDIISEINKVDVYDLMTDPIFWFYLKEKIKLKNKKPLINDNYAFTGKKDHWEFIQNSNNWTIIKNGDVLKNTISNSVTYLIMILKYHEIFNKESIHGFKLRRSVLKYEDQDYKCVLRNIKPSGTWRDRKNYLKNTLKVDEIKDFIEYHIIDKGDNVLVAKSDEFTFEVVSEIDIDSNFFSDLNNLAEAY